MPFGSHGLRLACAATTIHNEQLAFIYLLSLADSPELCGHIIKVITFGFLFFVYVAQMILQAECELDLCSFLPREFYFLPATSCELDADQ